MKGWSTVIALVAVLALAIGPLLAVLAVVLWMLTRLPKTYFGVCPGLTQPGQQEPGLTDWLADRIEVVAGRQPGTTPLTFGDLKAQGIDLQVMTTNLSMRRPHQLPQNLDEFYFKADEFEQLFPQWIMRYLMQVCEEIVSSDVLHLYRVPPWDALPVIVAVRMSLSFPILLAAVPLYTKDLTYRLNPAEQEKLSAYPNRV